MGKRTIVTILETSDLHGHVFPYLYGTMQEAPVGLSRVSTIVKRVRQENENVLLVDNGDLIQGTPMTYHTIRSLHEERNPMVLLLNELAYDAAVIGNHEFNYGIEPLHQAVNESQFPWLSANLLGEESSRPVFGSPYVVKETKDGVRVAILGVTTHYIPNWENPLHIQGIEFQDAYEATKQWVAWLRDKENPDVVIVSYHGGFESDLQSGEPTETHTGENQGYKLCMEMAGIDVLLTGHQHRLLAKSDVNGVAIVQPGNNGRAVGQVEITLEDVDGTWKIVQKKSSLLSTADEVPDEELLQKVNHYEQQTQIWLDKQIGEVQGDMIISHPLAARIREHPFVEFIQRVQMDAANTDVSNTALFTNEPAGLPKKVTMRDIVSNYVYPNTLTVLRLTGKQIREALERSATYFQVSENGDIEVNPSFCEPKPQHYNYDMWEGIEYEMDVSLPEGNRVVKLEKNGVPLQLDDQVDVVMNNYRAGGGGDYTMFKGATIVREVQIDMAEILANYFEKHPVVIAKCNDNFRVVCSKKD